VFDAMKRGLEIWPSRIVRSAGVFAVAVGIGVLFGWAFRVEWLMRIKTNAPSMAPLTALLLGVAGAVLLARLKRMANLAGKMAGEGAKDLPLSLLVSAGAIASVGLLELPAAIGGRSLGIESLGFHAGAEAAAVPPATALNLALLGAAILIAHKPRLTRLFGFAGAAVMLLGWLGTAHYVYSIDPVSPFAPMALHTAVCFLALGAGVLCTRPDAGLVSLLISEGPGGRMARRLMPAAMIMPICLGYLRLQGQRAGWYGQEAGMTIFSLVNISILGGLVWLNAASLESSDLQRRVAVTGMHSQQERLNLLHRITQTATEQQDLRKIYKVLLNDLEETLPFDFGCLCTYDEVQQRLMLEHLGARSGDLRELADVMRTPISIVANRLTACVMGRLIYQADALQWGTTFGEKIAAAGLRSVILAPLFIEGKVFGVLVAGRKNANGFSVAECEFLRQVSDHVALAANLAVLLSRQFAGERQLEERMSLVR
jgi:hypothetical protein